MCTSLCQYVLWGELPLHEGGTMLFMWKDLKGVGGMTLLCTSVDVSWTSIRRHCRMRRNPYGYVNSFLNDYSSENNNKTSTCGVVDILSIWPHDWKSVSLTTELRIIHAGSSKTIVPENSKAHCITLHKIHQQSKMRQIYCIHVWWNPH